MENIQLSPEFIDNLSSSKLITLEEYTKEFRETFSDVTFTGMKIEVAISILKERGFEKYRLWPHDGQYLSKMLKKEVIIYTDSEGKSVTKEPIYM